MIFVAKIQKFTELSKGKPIIPLIIPLITAHASSIY